MEIVDVVLVHGLNSPELLRWHSRRHSHPAPQCELHYFLSGSGFFENAGRRTPIRHGSLFWTASATTHAIQPTTRGESLSYFAVLFTVPSGTALAAAVTQRSFVASFPRMVGSRHRLLFEDLANRFVDSRGERRRAAAHLVYALLWDLAAETDDPNPLESADTESGFNTHVERAIHLFERHIGSPLTVAEVARRVGVTQAHLTRLFDRQFGVPPLQYYRRLRMEAAASYLVNSTLSVKEIAWELGYANPFHFSRSFRRFAGISPRGYRLQYFENNPTAYARRIVEGSDITS